MRRRAESYWHRSNAAAASWRVKNTKKINFQLLLLLSDVAKTSQSAEKHRKTPILNLQTFPATVNFQVGNVTWPGWQRQRGHQRSWETKSERRKKTPISNNKQEQSWCATRRHRKWKEPSGGDLWGESLTPPAAPAVCVSLWGSNTTSVTSQSHNKSHSLPLTTLNKASFLPSPEGGAVSRTFPVFTKEEKVVCFPSDGSLVQPTGVTAESQTGLVCEILDGGSLGWKIPEFSLNKRSR